MSEIYRKFQWPNGLVTKHDGVIDLFEDKTGKMILTKANGEKTLVLPGWVETSFLEVPKVLPPIVRAVDGDEAQ